MAQVSYPGVYIEEVPSGVRAISAVSTSIAAFVDRFRRGPTDEAVPIFGITEFERVFGGLDPDSPASYAITQFFLNGGTQALVVRVIAGTPSRAAMTIGGGPVTIQAQDAGEWANERIRVRIDPGSLPTTFDVVISEHSSSAPNASAVAQERLVGLTAANFVARLDESRLILASATAAVTPTINGLVWALPASVPAGLPGKTLNISLRIPTLPTATTDARTVTLNWTPAEAPTTLLGLASQIERAIRRAYLDSPAMAGATVQVVNGRAIVRVGQGGYHPGATVTLIGSGGTAAEPLGMVSATGTSLATSSPQEYVVGLPLGHTWGAFPIGGLLSSTAATPDAAIGPTDLVGSGSATEPRSGMQLLRDVDLFNILCIPRAAEFGSSERRFIYDNAALLCLEERAFLLVDPPSAVDTFGEAPTLRDVMTRSRNAAVFFPRVKVPDPLADFDLKPIGPSGTIAGIMARTDAERGVWSAPAGVDAVLRGVSELEVKLTDPENGVLNKLAINCLRSFPVVGRIAWGARTLDGPDDDPSVWRYIPVRRLALMIEESLFRGTKWAVFRPNDEPLWAQLRQNVGAFMHRLFRQKAFQGATPREAYFVKCDRETNPPEDRELGIVTVEVGFAPLKPAEFVIIRIQQIAEITA